MVAKWTGEYQLTLDAILDDMIVRCRELNLRAVGSERQADNGIHRAVDRQDGACAFRSVAAKVDRAMKRLRVLVLLHPDLMPPDSSKGYSEQEINAWKTEYDVVSTLRAAGHEVRPLGVHDELKPIRDEIDELEAGRGVQSARAVSRRSRLRPERRELSRAACASLIPAAIRAA